MASEAVDLTLGKRAFEFSRLVVENEKSTTNPLVYSNFEEKYHEMKASNTALLCSVHTA